MVHSDLVVLARKQHGLVTLAQLQKLGFTRAQIRTRTDRDEWSPAASGVLRVGGAPVTWESQVCAHVLAAGPGAMVSHKSAAVLWGFEGYHRATPEITVPRRRNYRTGEAKVHSSTDLELVAPRFRNGLPVTPVARTLLDLGASVSRNKLHLTIEVARRRGLTDWDGLLSSLAAHARRGRPGVAALRAILELHHAEIATTDSGFELLVATTLQEAGLPAPVRQHEVHIKGQRYRIDLAYPRASVAIELDGSQHRDAPVWEADHPRQNDLVMAGWTVLRYTWRYFRSHRRDMIREIRAAVSRR